MARVRQSAARFSPGAGSSPAATRLSLPSFHYPRGSTMHKQSLIRNVAIAAATAALLASCASSSKVMLGQARADRPGTGAGVFQRTGRLGGNRPARIDQRRRLRHPGPDRRRRPTPQARSRQARRQRRGHRRRGLRTLRRRPVGRRWQLWRPRRRRLGIGIPTTQKRAAGVAIWVPAGRSSARHRMFRRRRGKARKIHLHQCTRARWMTVCSLPLRPVVLHPPELVSAWLVARE